MGETDHQIIDTTATSTRSKDYTDTEAANEERGRKRGRGRKTADVRTEETGGTAETDLPRVVLVDVPDTGKADQEETAAPKPKRKRKDIQFELKKDQVSILIKTCFDIAGSREGQEIWKLSQKEADLIAEPLNNILNKNPVVGAITSKYGDVIALAVAMATVILPRLMIQLSTKTKKEGKVKPYVAINEPSSKSKTNTENGQQARKDGNNLRQLTRESTQTNTTFGGQLHSIVPTIQ